jgi:hypothetical protein
MTNDEPVFKSTAMPAATQSNYPRGAYSPMTAGVILQQQQNASQLKLINPSGGRRLRGGQSNANALILVPQVPAGAVDPAATKGNYTAITNLAEVGASQSVYDSAQTKEAAAANQKAGSKKGGKWKKGGSWPVWGCLSGGRKYRRKSRKGRKSRKNRKTKRRHR